MKNNLFLPVILIISLVLLLPATSQAKKKDNNQWFITPRIGTATLLKEITSDFKSPKNEFQNSMGFSADLAVSRTFGSNFEVGLQLAYYSLSSKDDSLTIPDLSSYNESNITNITYYPSAPIEYKTTSIIPSLFMRYYFKKFDAKNDQLFQPYVEISVGQNIIDTELSYKDTTGFNNPPDGLPSVWLPAPNVADSVSVKPYESPEKALQLSLALGSRLNFKNGVTLNISAEISRVQTQFMDGTPNPAVYDIKATLVPRLMLGVAIPLKQGRSRGHSGGYLPWAP